LAAHDRADRSGDARRAVDLRKDAQLVLRRECAATGTVQKFRRRSSRRWNDRRPPAVLLISAGCCKSLAVFDFGHNHWMFVLCPKGKLPAGVCLIIIGTEGNVSLSCSPIGHCFMDTAEQWEPDDARVSRPVLRERGGETPPRHSPRHHHQRQETLALARRRSGRLRA